MSEAGDGGDPRHLARTQEQHDVVRRRALPVAVCGVICGVTGLAWMLNRSVGPFNPPNLIGSNLAICALLMGVGMLFYARGTSGTRLAVGFSVVAIVLGLLGPVLFAWQSIEYRRMSEGRELESVRAIAVGARQYAESHGGKYPADLLVLLEENLVKPEMLQSPFGQPHALFWKFDEARKGVSREDLLKSVETETDYLYLGSDLTLKGAGGAEVPAEVWKDVIVGASNGTVMRVNLALSFADGSARFITLDEAKQVLQDCNAAREKLGLGKLRPPAVIERAMEEAAAAATQGR